ncbi:MAG: RNA polymerase sigma factor [Bryobacteraceae bacterium]
MQATVERFPAIWPRPEPRESSRIVNDEAALVRRAQASDQMAFREIVDRYQATVFSVIRRLLRDHKDAEDVAQEVFARVFLSIGRYESRGALLSWIYRITVNECYAYLRRRKVRPLVCTSDLTPDELRVFEAGSPAPLFDSTVADRDLALNLLACVSEQERCLLLMRVVEGYSIQELSGLTGIPVNTVKVKLLRARRKLLNAAGRRGWAPKLRA